MIPSYILQDNYYTSVISIFKNANSIGADHAVNTIKTAIKHTMSQIRAAIAAVDIRDIFIFGGLGLLGYGLFLFKGPWLAFTVCGTLLMIIGGIAIFTGKS